jgi:hypothetical protein
LHSKISNWQTAVINAMEEFKSDLGQHDMAWRNVIPGPRQVLGRGVRVGLGRPIAHHGQNQFHIHVAAIGQLLGTHTVKDRSNYFANAGYKQPGLNLSRARQSDRWQSAFDVGARQLKPRRQLERRAETIGRLVDRKAGWVGRDLEQDAAGFTEIYRTEIPAIENRCHIESERKDLFAPTHLLLIAARSERDVVDGAAAPLVALSLGLA